MNGEISDRLVFVSREHPELFLVLGTDEHSAEFVVDFDKRKVSAYAHGNSVFVPPSHKFCVIVLEGAWGIGGIPVSVAADNPAFEGHTVSWR